MKKIVGLTTCALLATGGVASAQVLFDQNSTVTADWFASDGTVDISNPPAGVSVTGNRQWGSADAGIGILNNASDVVEWTFDFSYGGTDPLTGSDDTYNVIIAGTSGTFDASGTTPADSYLLGTALQGGNLLFGWSNSGGKNGVVNSLYDTGVAAAANASGSATITFDPSNDEWTVTGSFNGSSFSPTGNTFTDTTYTGVNTDFLGVYNRTDDGDAVTLDNMKVSVIPEPTTATLILIVGISGLGLFLRRRR